MYRIGKLFHFSASHSMPHLPDDHPCHRLHGHNYTVQVIFESDELNDDSFVLDYREMSDFKGMIDTMVDHRDLNEVMHPIRTTSENIAQWFWEFISLKYPDWPLAMIRISETGKTFAEYRP